MRGWSGARRSPPRKGVSVFSSAYSEGATMAGRLLLTAAGGNDARLGLDIPGNCDYRRHFRLWRNRGERRRYCEDLVLCIPGCVRNQSADGPSDDGLTTNRLARSGSQRRLAPQTIFRCAELRFATIEESLRRARSSVG